MLVMLSVVLTGCSNPSIYSVEDLNDLMYIENMDRIKYSVETDKGEESYYYSPQDEKSVSYFANFKLLVDGKAEYDYNITTDGYSIGDVTYDSLEGIVPKEYIYTIDDIEQIVFDARDGFLDDMGEITEVTLDENKKDCEYEFEHGSVDYFGIKQTAMHLNIRKDNGEYL